jgi:hypothetical protein
MSSAQSIELQHALSLSPVMPKDSHMMDLHLQHVHLTPLPRRRRDTGPFQFTDEELETSTLPDWTPEMVAQRMLNAGVELNAAERFVENDINGAILITLKFEDLKELGISSFGVRTRVWEEIHTMRDLKKPEPMAETPIEDEPDKTVKRELRRQESGAGSRKQKPRVKLNDVISPLESVSIVGIEQVLPKPHHCSKGEKCAKWKRNQRLMEAFKKDHPFINDNGIIMVAGDPGNPERAGAIVPGDDSFRPMSDAVPSVVASSDVMGPGSLPPLQYLQEKALRNLQARDPQENVRQFLDFQRPHLNASSEVPPTPPFEILPHGNQKNSHRSLPKLAIPSQPAVVTRRDPQSAQARSARPTSQAIPSFRELSPSSDEGTPTPTAPYRFGTPFSEMDVPITVSDLADLPPVSRDFSQSVPPDMNYRHNPAPPRSMSRNTIRRPSYPVMPALDENSILSPSTQAGPGPKRSFSQRVNQRPLQPPPRMQYPWTQSTRPTLEKAVPPTPTPASTGTTMTTSPTPSPTTGTVKTVNINGRHSPISSTPAVDMTAGSAISYQGLMRKRKTKMLRHEWHEHFFTLRGTRLTMHKDAAAATKMNKTLEYIDVDDYAIACGGAASGGKFNAAIRAWHNRRGNSDDAAKKEDVAAFSFQLIPQLEGGGAKPLGGVKLRKRESTAVPAGLAGLAAATNMAAAAAPVAGAAAGKGAAAAKDGSKDVPPPIEGAVNGTGKTHHFAVKGRDERIDWMRELMLAKARKQKGEGFEVSVNGNMI